MARSRKTFVPHHIRERLRHQKLQRQLNMVSDRVPKPYDMKKETKDTKLRRLILYMLFLLKKKNQISKNSPCGNGITCSKDSLKKCRAEKRSGLIFKKSPHRGILNNKAQIIFLKKSSPLTTETKCDLGEKENTASVNQVYPGLFENGSNTENIGLNFNVKEDSSNSCAGKSYPLSENISSHEQNPNLDESKYIPNGAYNQYSLTEKSSSMMNCNWEHTSKKIPPCYNCCVRKKLESEEENKNILYESPLTSIENTRKHYNIQYPLIDSSSIDSKSVKENLLDQYNFENSCNSNACLNNVANGGPLPPMSIFSSKFSVNGARKADAKTKEFLTCVSPSETKQSTNQLENYLMMPSDEQMLKNNLYSRSTLLPDYNYSPNMHLPDKCAAISLSNEWVSDDTVTDSGSLTMSSSWESATSSTAFRVQPTRSNKCAIKSDFNCDMYFKPKEEHNDSNYGCFYGELSPNRRDYSVVPENKYDYNALYQNRCDSVNKKYHEMSFNQTSSPKISFNLHQNCEKSNLPSFMFPARNMSRIPFVVQKKREQNFEDYYVPHPMQEIDSSAHEPVSYFDSSNNYGNANGVCFLNQHIKEEVEDSLLPEKEISYSFKNFSQWCPDNCDM